MAYEPGQVIDRRYEVLAVLGHGGMGEAYKARDGATGQLVVVKIPYASLIGDPATFSRYQREMEIGRRLQHPNIQHLVAEGRLEGGVAPYMVLEYVEGRGLRAYLAQHAPLCVEEAVRIACQLTEALQYCHEQGVIHRDLKPENVLITPEGQAKLVDFGIALLRGARRLTFRRLSSSVGTPDYMAPEQVRGERGDARTDIYAVGVMLFEMVTGEVPYQGDSPLAVMSQRTTKEAPLLRSVRRDVPAGLEAVVARALSLNPAERYQSMAELRHDLQHLDEVTLPTRLLAPARMPGSSPVGAMPSALATAGIVLGVLASLAAIGAIAELIHRNLAR